MFRTLFLVAILLTVASAATADILTTNCPSVQCNGLNGLCDTFPNTNTVTSCKNSYYCSVSSANATAGGTCLTAPTLLQSCSSSTGPCYNNNNYNVACLGGTCYYVGAVGPGETCPSTTSNYNNNNPCAVTTASCSGTCGTVISSGQNCNATNYCGKGQFCNGTCVNRVGSGGSCISTSQCQFGYVCSALGGTGGAQCVALFSVGSGSGCSTPYDCGSGLYCHSGTCTAVNNGGSCVVPDEGTAVTGCPASDYDCVCDGSNSNSNGQCEAPGFPSSVQSAITGFYSCMAQNCAWDIIESPLGYTFPLVGYTPDSCAAQKCSGSYNNAISYLGTVCGSSSVTIFVALVLALAALALLI